jgi:hypothetical protein
MEEYEGKKKRWKFGDKGAAGRMR